MKTAALLVAAGAALLTGVVNAQSTTTGDAPLKFLERRNLPYPQTTPLPMPRTSEAVMEHNKQVVLDFYKIISDKRQFTQANMDKYFWPDFVQHDPAEPSTSAAFFAYFNSMRGPAGAGGKAPPRKMGQMSMPGKASVDSNGSPVNWMVAEGDIVVVARHRNWAWPGGPEPVYDGIFVDIWRVVDGKIKEQWCSCTPADAQLKHIFEAKKAGMFPKTPE